MVFVRRSEFIDFGQYLRDICANLVSMSPSRDGVELIGSFAPGCHVRPDQVAPVVRIAKEVVANALRHAHPAGVRGRLMVECHREVNGDLVIGVADDGVGLPEGFDPAVGGGRGFRLVRALSGRLGASVTFASSELGLAVCLRVPVRPVFSGASVPLAREAEAGGRIP
jgi:two-component sensor histidine kinase